MTNITPITGWLLDRAVGLDAAYPGFLGHLLRASDERRQVIAAYLAANRPNRAFGDGAALGQFLSSASHTAILRAVYGRVPAGLRGALGRSGAEPHRKRYYSYLFALHASTARPEMRPLLRQLTSISPDRLKIIRVLQPRLRQARLVEMLRNETAARDLTRLVALMLGANGDHAAMLDALGKATTMDQVKEWARRWAFRLDLPEHPVPASDSYVPVRTAEELRRLALRYRNCARNYLSNTLEGRSAFAVVTGEKASAVVHLVNEKGRWRLDEVYGRSNGTPDKGVSEIARSYLAQHSVHPRSRQMPVEREWSCLRRFIGHWDHEDDWDA